MQSSSGTQGSSVRLEWGHMARVFGSEHENEAMGTPIDDPASIGHS